MDCLLAQDRFPSGMSNGLRNGGGCSSLQIRLLRSKSIMLYSSSIGNCNVDDISSCYVVAERALQTSALLLMEKRP